MSNDSSDAMADEATGTTVNTPTSVSLKPTQEKWLDNNFVSEQTYLLSLDFQLKIVSRSLLPKFDHLSLSVHSYHPHIIESLLCNEIASAEIAIPGYWLFRKHSNQHGDSVAIIICY